jgi:hypothetical protein
MYFLRNQDVGVNIIVNLYLPLSTHSFIRERWIIYAKVNRIISSKIFPPQILRNILNQYSDTSQGYNLLVTNNNLFKNEEYELSLLGEILVLTFIRWNDRGMLPNGLHYAQISFAEYVDKIVDSYRKRLPVIFEHWAILKDFLEIFASYNLDVILDKDLRQKYIHRSVVSGGIEEYYELIRMIATRARNQISMLLNDGLNTCINFTEVLALKNAPDKNRLEEFRKLAKERTNVLYNVITKKILHVNPFTQSNQLDESNKKYLLLIKQDLLATEIGFFYYLFMFRNDHFQFSKPMKYLESHKESINDPTLMLSLCKDFFSDIIAACPMANEFISNIMKDISTFQEIVRRELQEIRGLTC